MRQDVPGTAGWAESVEGMAASLRDEELDPDLYLVAVDRHTSAPEGIIRVWMCLPTPKVGFIGVVPAMRRTRLAAMMLQEVGARLRRRGLHEVTARTDVQNWASHTLAARHGGRSGAVSIEYVRG